MSSSRTTISTARIGLDTNDWDGFNYGVKPSYPANAQVDENDGGDVDFSDSK